MAETKYSEVNEEATINVLEHVDLREELLKRLSWRRGSNFILCFPFRPSKDMYEEVKRIGKQQDPGFAAFDINTWHVSIARFRITDPARLKALHNALSKCYEDESFRELIASSNLTILPEVHSWQRYMALDIQFSQKLVDKVAELFATEGLKIRTETPHTTVGYFQKSPLPWRRQRMKDSVVKEERTLHRITLALAGPFTVREIDEDYYIEIDNATKLPDLEVYSKVEAR